MEPASTNEVLRQREAVLQRCVQSLSATLEQWGAAVEAEPARLGADAAPAEPAELELPELPNLAEQLARLQGVAALHADQAELTLRRVGAMVDESAVQRKQLAASAHHTSFSGCARARAPATTPRRPYAAACARALITRTSPPSRPRSRAGT